MAFSESLTDHLKQCLGQGGQSNNSRASSANQPNQHPNHNNQNNENQQPQSARPKRDSVGDEDDEEEEEEDDEAEVAQQSNFRNPPRKSPKQASSPKFFFQSNRGTPVQEEPSNSNVLNTATTAFTNT